jgi:hypothetical protein
MCLGTRIYTTEEQGIMALYTAEGQEDGRAWALLAPYPELEMAAKAGSMLPLRDAPLALEEIILIERESRNDVELIRAGLAYDSWLTGWFRGVCRVYSHNGLPANHLRQIVKYEI